MTVTRKKSEVCQERSSDMGAGEVCSACGLSFSANTVQTTAATWLHCAKCWRQTPLSSLFRDKVLTPIWIQNLKWSHPSYWSSLLFETICTSLIAPKWWHPCQTILTKMSCCYMRICCVSPAVQLSQKERVKLHLLPQLTEHISVMTACPVIVY